MYIGDFNVIVENGLIIINYFVYVKCEKGLLDVIIKIIINEYF